MTKQEKLEKHSAQKILAELNNLLSLISDEANDTGFQVSAVTTESLRIMHAELFKIVVGK